MRKVAIYDYENEEDFTIVNMTEEQYALLMWLQEENYIYDTLVIKDIDPNDEVILPRRID